MSRALEELTVIKRQASMHFMEPSRSMICVMSRKTLMDIMATESSNALNTIFSYDKQFSYPPTCMGCDLIVAVEEDTPTQFYLKPGV